MGLFQKLKDWNEENLRMEQEQGTAQKTQREASAVKHIQEKQIQLEAQLEAAAAKIKELEEQAAIQNASLAPAKTEGQKTPLPDDKVSRGQQQATKSQPQIETAQTGREEPHQKTARLTIAEKIFCIAAFTFIVVAGGLTLGDRIAETQAREQQRIEQEQIAREQERLAKERERQEQERLAKERERQEQERLAREQEQAQWEVGYYVDAFKQPTKKAYIANKEPFVGIFSNNTTTDSKLYSTIIVDQYGIYIILYEYEYGSNRVQNPSWMGSEIYLITMKIGDNIKPTFPGEIYPAPNGEDRITIKNLVYREAVLHALKGNEAVSFYIEKDADRSNNYLFTVPISNFNFEINSFLRY